MWDSKSLRLQTLILRGVKEGKVARAAATSKIEKEMREIMGSKRPSFPDLADIEDTNLGHPLPLQRLP